MALRTRLVPPGHSGLLDNLNTYNPGAWAIGAVTGKKINYPVNHPESELSKRYRIVTKAAERYRINPVILWGVYGVETSHGANVTTSSTGAKGSFQFEPETARQYGYPYTNATDAVTFNAQANAAARYLAALLPGGHGEAGLKSGPGWTAAWEKALRAYSGGGYGLAQAKAHGAAASSVVGNEAANKAETAKVEGEASKGYTFGLFAKWALTGVLLVIGAVLIIYGIMVAVRPRESAFAVPRPV
jgi:hypothetical protein